MSIDCVIQYIFFSNLISSESSAETNLTNFTRDSSIPIQLRLTFIWRHNFIYLFHMNMRFPADCLFWNKKKKRTKKRVTIKTLRSASLLIFVNKNMISRIIGNLLGFNGFLNILFFNWNWQIGKLIHYYHHLLLFLLQTSYKFNVNFKNVLFSRHCPDFALKVFELHSEGVKRHFLK